MLLPEISTGSEMGDGTASPPPSARLPLNLARYLPAYLWQKLTEDVLRRGVLLNALERLQATLYLIRTYLPNHLAQEQMQDPRPGRIQGKMLHGTLLFADVSGFTALSERLAGQGREGAEQLTHMINGYFDRMLDILARSGGILLKFAGDALLAYFPEQEGDEQARWAVRAGQRMLRCMADFAAIETPLGTVSLQSKIGISSGPFLAASVGSSSRMEYVILGESVARTMAAEGAAEAGQLIVDEATAAVLEPSACTRLPKGLYAVQSSSEEDLGDFEIKAEARRGRGTASWIADRDEIIAHIERALRQIEALTPYLATELVERIIASAGQRHLESEFRPTVVLFINYTGFEALLETWGKPSRGQEAVQRVTRLLNDYFNAMRRVIGHYGGIVSRIDPYREGSKMLVLFGAPVAHEDDPQRAVRAALAMGRELAGLNERWYRAQAAHLPPDWEGPLVQQRIGVTRGTTFAGQAGSSTRREYTVMGDDVNLAARLMAAAPPGQVLLSQAVYESVRHHFHLTALRPIQVKGKREPVPIYRTDGVRKDRLSERLRSRPPLVGRSGELAMGRESLSRALAGQGSVLTIRGPAGIGKSHLADTLAAKALERGARVLLSEARAYAAEAPYASWVTLVQAIAGISPADPPGVRSERLLNLLRDLDLTYEAYVSPLSNLLGLPARDVPAGPQPPVKSRHTAAEPGHVAGPTLFDRLSEQVTERKEGGLDLWRLTRERQPTPARPMWQRLEERVAAREQARLFEAARGLLERLAADRPLFLLFENAQWIDPTSWEFLQRLGKSVDAQPILLLLVQRSEDVETDEAGFGQTIELSPLGLADTRALVEQLLPEPPAQTDRAALAEAIYEQSGGNPLFIEESVRYLERAREGPADLRRLLRDSTTLQELILSRLDSLPHSQRDVARAASVVGREFHARDLQPLLEWPQQTALADGLTGLEETGLILCAEVGAKPGYAFRQTLIRELIYESLPFARRRSWHARLAGSIECDYAGDLAQYADLLAHHYELADDDFLSACYLLLSGHKALQRYAYAQAMAYYSRALATLQRLPPGQRGREVADLQAQAYEGQGDVALLSGDLAAAGKDYSAALSILGEEVPGPDPGPAGEPLPDEATDGETLSQAKARLLLKLALVLPTQGQAAAAEAGARRVWATHPEGTDLAAAATLAWLLWRAASTEADEWIEWAAWLASGESDRWTARVAALLSDLAGDWAAAGEAYLALDRPAGAALAACRQGDRYLEQGDTTAALAQYDQATALWEQEGDAYGLALARYRQAQAYRDRGDASAAGAALEETLHLLDSAPAAAQEDRTVLQQVLEAVRGGRVATWPPWHWQRYDDALRVSILFRP